jgi:hypothetical protein
MGVIVSGVMAFTSGAGTGGTSVLNLQGTRDGGLYPLTGNTSGSIQFGSPNATGTGNALANVRIRAITTENHSVTNAGTGFNLQTTINGTNVSNAIININQYGQLQLGANGTQPSATLAGSGLPYRVVIGNMTTYSTNAAVQVSNPVTGADNITLLVQGTASQTNGVFRCEQSTGQTLFLIGIAGSVTNAATAVPAVAPTNQGRFYYDTATQTYKFSGNGSAYASLVLASGGTISGALTITASSANALAVGPNGTTNPTLNVVTNVASAATGLSITGNAAGSAVTLAALSSGANENLAVAAKGTGQILWYSNLRFENGLVNVLYGNGQASFLLLGNDVGLQNGNTGRPIHFDASLIHVARTGLLGWGSNFDDTNPDTNFSRSDTAVIRVGGASTAAGSLIIGPSTASIGTSGVAVLAIGGSTAPSSSPADQWQLYSLDWNGGGTAAPHFRTEDSTIWRLGGTALSTSADAVANLGTAAESFIQLFLDQTLIASGTTGNQTIDKSAGSVNFAAAATTLTVTCNKCTANSIVICTVLTAADTAGRLISTVPGAGSFVIHVVAPTAEMRVGFWVLNQ